jgi:hypothetical protein
MTALPDALQAAKKMAKSAQLTNIIKPVMSRCLIEILPFHADGPSAEHYS